jgi:hypothetical protein
MFADMSRKDIVRGTRVYKHLTPEFCTRSLSVLEPTMADAQS